MAIQKQYEQHTYKTYDEYLRYLATKTGISLLEVANTNNINYRSIMSNYKVKRLGNNMIMPIMKALNGDWNILMNLPLRSELDKSRTN